MSETLKRGCGKPMGSSGYLMSFCGDVTVPLCTDCQPLEPRKWTRRPEWDEAEQLTIRNVSKIAQWCGSRVKAEGRITLPGGPEVLPGDWVVRASSTGEFRVMSNAEFCNVYEPVRLR
jgi:hypothetical protein